MECNYFYIVANLTDSVLPPFNAWAMLPQAVKKLTHKLCFRYNEKVKRACMWGLYYATNTKAIIAVTINSFALGFLFSTMLRI